MWRGLILNRAVQQFLQDAHWGDLDYLLIDLPPGTGDVQMGLARLLPRTEMLVVTTPPLAAQKVAARAADMARKGYLRVAGVIENMSDFTCEHGTTYALFGSGGGEPPGPRVGRPADRLHPPPPRPGRGRRRRDAGGRRGRRARHALRRAGPRGGRGGGAAPRDVVLLGPPGRAGARPPWPAAKPSWTEPGLEPGPGGHPAPAGSRRCPRPVGSVERLGPALFGQIPQMGPQGEPGHRELRLGDVGVDLRQELIDRALAQARRRASATRAWRPSRWAIEGVHHLARRAPSRRPCPGASRSIGGSRSRTRARLARYVAQVAVGRADHHGRAVHHMVAGQQGPALLEEPTQVIRGMPRSVDRLQGEAPVAAPSPPGSVNVQPPPHAAGPGRSPRPGRSPPPGRRWPRPGAAAPGRVVEVGVGDQYPAERPAAPPRQPAAPPGDPRRPGRGRSRPVRDRADQVAVGARSGHEPGVGRGQADEIRGQLHRLPGHRRRPDPGVGHRCGITSPASRRRAARDGDATVASGRPPRLAARETARMASLKFSVARRSARSGAATSS